MCFRTDKTEENRLIEQAIAKAASGQIAKISFAECSGLAYAMNRKKLATKSAQSEVAVYWIDSGAVLVKR